MLPAPATDEEFQALCHATTTVEIPSDLIRWHPNEITQWITAVDDDAHASDGDVHRAHQAVAYALGINPADLPGAAPRGCGSSVS
ncbi:hypothetical protein CG740_35115 [Streptomyces sp. CB01201]|uniref:hypothetical protein n=1 Tax=Streptomyces sp. CB01201 TaxID=2020324 RepID=UPI000C2793B1|nr:hypothetical protein [Streptomyces sp. CB01201]PJM98490.1 hypothetical protein CG740_35115 [Streptomyces sp. CB01201]